MYLSIDEQSCRPFSIVLLTFILLKETIRNWLTSSSNIHI
jgi:hypothetical protein